MPTTPPTSYFKEDFTNMEGLSVFFSCLHAVGDPVFGGDVTGGDLTPAGFSACWLSVVCSDVIVCLLFWRVTDALDLFFSNLNLL